MTSKLTLHSEHRNRKYNESKNENENKNENINVSRCIQHISNHVVSYRIISYNNTYCHIILRYKNK
jgi:hypothetical protein